MEGRYKSHLRLEGIGMAGGFMEFQTLDRKNINANLF